MLSVADTRAGIVALREMHVATYRDYVSYIGGELTSQAIYSIDQFSVFSRKRFEAMLARHSANYVGQITSLRVDLHNLASTAFGSKDQVVLDFSDSLADEAIQCVIAQMTNDVTRLSRFFVEAIMGVILRTPYANRSAAVKDYLEQHAYRNDSLGRRLRAERYVFATINQALFRSYNESFVYGHPDAPLLLSIPDQPDVSFSPDYYQNLNPFSEPIVFV